MINKLIFTRVQTRVYYLTNRAAMRESRLGKSYYGSRTVVADHIKVVFQRRVSGALKVHRPCRLIYPDLIKKRKTFVSHFI